MKMEKFNSELKSIIADRFKVALENTDLSVKLNDSWAIGTTKKRLGIVIYRGVHPLAVFDIYDDFNNILSVDLANQLVSSKMNLTKSRFGIVTDNNQFFLSR